jgi:hypothetical protein
MRARRPELIPAVLIAVLLAVLFVVASLAIRMPHTVRLTVQNQIAWQTEVSVRPADSESWTGAGAVARDSQLDFLALPDQGDEWVIRFSYAGQSEDVAISRDALAAQDWTITVPRELGDQLEGAGIAPTSGTSTTGATNG